MVREMSFPSQMRNRIWRCIEVVVTRTTRNRFVLNRAGRIPPSPPTKGTGSGWCLFCGQDGADENRAAVRRPQATSPAGCCLARGRIPPSPPTKGTSSGWCLFCGQDGADENRAAVRRPQAISPVGLLLSPRENPTISARSRRFKRICDFFFCIKQRKTAFFLLQYALYMNDKSIITWGIWILPKGSQ